MHYDWIFFDADDTLFHFDSYSGLKLMLHRKGMTLTEEVYLDYESVNKPLWVDYQNGTISAGDLKRTRFQRWADLLNTSPELLNKEYMRAMGDICHLLPGAKELIEALSGKVHLGIITNGFSDLQTVRLERTGMLTYFEQVIISEEVGIAKPDRRIFDHALTLIGNPDRNRVLMVGDNPHSDIAGGLNAGITTCWLNAHGIPSPDTVAPHFEVNSLADLHQRLFA